MQKWREKLLEFAFLIGLFGGAPQVFAQTTSPPPPSQNKTASDSAPLPERKVSWKLLGPNVVHDQKPIWLSPKDVAEGKHLKPTIAVVAVTGGLIATDPIDTPYWRGHSLGGFNSDFSGLNTTAAMTAFPVAFYLYGLARKDTYAQHTVLLAGESVLDSEIVTTVMKDLDRRLLPKQVPPNGDYSDTWFVGHGQVLRGTGSFLQATPSQPSHSRRSLPTAIHDRGGIVGWHSGSRGSWGSHDCLCKPIIHRMYLPALCSAIPSRTS